MGTPRKRMLAAYACVAFVLSGCGTKDENAATDEKPTAKTEESRQIQYLEIVTPDVAAVCATYAELHGITFSEPVAELGNARTAELPSGGKLGVRAPMHEAEEPVVRPYLLVDDVAAAIKAVEAAGAEIAHPPKELPGHGIFAIYIQGGIQHGLWQR